MDVFKLNVLGTRNTILPSLKYMTRPKDGARIMMVSSQAGLAGIYGYTAYSVRCHARTLLPLHRGACACVAERLLPTPALWHLPVALCVQASKFALNGFAQSLQHEVYARNIRVSLSFPPDTDTPLLASENLQKPHITRLLSESTATVSADTVGTGMVAGLERWSPLVPVGFDGWMLSTLTVGMGPAGSFFDAFVQVFTLGLWRFIGLFYVQYFFSVISKHDQPSAAGAAAAAAGAGSASATGAKKGTGLSASLVSPEDKDK